MDRRSFLKDAAALGGLCAMGGCATAKVGAGEEDGTVRFLAFADIHYASSGFWPHAEWAWTDRVLQRAVDTKCDFVMSLGDMTFGPATEDERDYIRHYNEFKPVKTYHTYGNHEYETVTPEELDRVYGLKKGYYSFDVKGFRFIVLDPHYRLKDGRYLRFYKRCSYPEKGEWGHERMVPPEQMAWLRETIMESPYPCVVFSHESIEQPCAFRINNYKEIQEIFRAANKASPGKVRLAVNGHNHTDNFRIYDGVAYLDLNSATYDILQNHTAYPEWYRQKCGSAKCVLTWNDPLSAVITLTKEGRLKIDGSESTYYLGVTPEKAAGNIVTVARRCPSSSPST